jgi:endonuclease YncB( thermonuclease family)
LTGASTAASSWHAGWGGSGLAVWLGLVFLSAPATAAGICDWREPPRTYADGVRWSCTAVGWPDGDTLRARCDGHTEAVKVRLRGVDTDERGQGRWLEAREELRRRTAGRPLAVDPRHLSHDRVVADVLADGVNVGAAMDAAGWSKTGCPKR